MKRMPRRLLISMLGIASITAAFAQPAGTLYDPEPPQDSGYLRVFWAAAKGAVDIWVDGRLRASTHKAGTVSDYLIVPAGVHTIAIRDVGAKKDKTTAQLELQRGGAVTMAFVDTPNNLAPFVFQDKANSNKLKAMLSIYNLHPKLETLSVTTADAKTKVFSDVAYGKHASLQVNPIQAELSIFTASDTKESGRAKLAMSAGSNYSIFVSAQENERIHVSTVESKTEKYRSK